MTLQRHPVKASVNSNDTTLSI